MHSFFISQVSRNAKTGPIPVTTTSNDSCPDSCAFRGNGCYAESGPLGFLWRKLSETKPGDKFKNGRAMLQSVDFSGLIKEIKKISKGQIWRHNQAGDLPGMGATIDHEMVEKIVAANRGKRGFTYTHKPAIGRNLDIIRKANQNGFTINISANSAEHAAKLKSANPDLPVVCVLPIDAEKSRYVESGNHKITVCPATRKNADGSESLPHMTCAKCGLCAVSNRRAIVGFPAHGAGKRKASAIANG